MDPKQSVYNGLLMTAGILGSTFVVKKVKKDLAPQLSTGSAVALGTVTILSRLAIDYLQEKQYVPDKIWKIKMGSINPAGSTNPKKDDSYFTYSITIGPIDHKKCIYNGLLMTTGILGTVFVLTKLGEGKYAPKLYMKDYFSLATVTILSEVGITYWKAKGWIPAGLR